MHRRALLVSRPPPSLAGKGVARISRRRLATEASPSAAPTPKKPKTFRRIFYTTAVAGTTFYIGSTFVAFNHQGYYNFFSDHVPLGQAMLEYAEHNNWDTLTVASAIESVKDTVVSTQNFVMAKINGTPIPEVPKKDVVEKKTRELKDTAVRTFTTTKERAQSTVKEIKTDSKRAEDEVVEKLPFLTKHQEIQISEELRELVREAEDALNGKFPVAASSASDSAPSVYEVPADKEEKHIYTEPLPVGFEPPPGYERPTPPPRKVVPTAPPIPIVASTVSEVSDPIIKHLAGTIDNLASYLKSNPTAASQITPVLETAKGDLSALVQHIQNVKEEERKGLEAKLDEQTRDYNLKLIELEMEAQDKLDNREEQFRKVFDESQVALTRAYREKLDTELQTHLEIINERLKEEVVAQGIELQRRWIREVKVHVEEERGGRLAKLDELSSQLKRLERIALDNSTYLDENIRIHALWTATRALFSSALASPVRKPFREELRILRHVAVAREDPLTAAALDVLDANEVADIGVEPFADLTSWFTTSVVPKVSRVALVPDQDAGLLSHLASHVLSNFRFKRQGLVAGNDVLSVLSRAEYYLIEKDLESATRELNQLKGTAQVLLADWLAAARQRLEVEQALEVVQTQATLASVLLV